MPPDNDMDFAGDMSATYAEIQTRESSGAGEGNASTTSPPSTAPASPSPSAGTPAPAAPPAAPPPATPEPFMEFPKSWKKDYAPLWEGISPEARKIIHEREKQAFEGISKYKGVADKWGETLTPYEKVFNHYGIDPHEAFRSLADAHLTLLYGTPEHKRQLAEKLNKDYGLSELLGGQPSAALDPSIAAPLQALQQQVQQLGGVVQGYQSAQQKAIEAQTTKEVNEFFADKSNEFAGEVLQDMMHLFKVGAASDLKSAYDMAIWTNPSTRATLLGREAEKIAKSKVPDTPDVRSSTTPAAPTSSPDESIDDTLRDTFRKINQRR